MAGTAASEFQSLSVEVYFLSCSSLLSWACSSLTCYISFFVANENEDCSALTNEIIVTMHTFQDVSRPEGLRKGRAGELVDQVGEGLVASKYGSDHIAKR